MRRQLTALAFFGGGTGGHLYPGIAVAERARERFPGCRAVFFRTERGVEDRVFEARQLETRTLRLRAPGKGVLRWLRYSLEAAAAAREIQTLLEEGFEAAFGLGGYASLPGLFAARETGLPTILLEQNAVPGRVNALLAPFVDAVCSSHEQTSFPLAARLEITGNPVRKEVLDAALERARRQHRPEALESSGRRTVLVVGGSQGARGLNVAIRRALPELLELRERIRWIHVAGDADKEGMAEAYRINGWEAEVFAYTSSLPELMAQSDLVFGRAGGTTLSELAVLGLPSVLVPYPHHGDKHQFANARTLARRGAACVLEEKAIDAGKLRAIFHEVLFSPERLSCMARGAQALAKPHAADAVLDLALDLKKQCPQPFVSFS